MISGNIFIISAIIVAIWVLIEFKRMRHKLFAFFLIGLILFSYLSTIFLFQDQDVNLKTISGVISASKLYFSWMGSVLGNFKRITTNAINMDWGNDEKLEDVEKDIFGWLK